MILLGVDLGDRRIGFSTCDEMWLVAVSLRTEKVRSLNDAADKVEEAYNEIGAQSVILGYPRDMSGKRGKKAKEAENFAEILKNRGIPTTLWDERLTTAEAHRVMKDANISRKNRMKVIDEISAQRILDNYMQANQDKRIST